MDEFLTSTPADLACNVRDNLILTASSSLFTAASGCKSVARSSLVSKWVG